MKVKGGYPAIKRHRQKEARISKALKSAETADFLKIGEAVLKAIGETPDLRVEKVIVGVLKVP